MIIVEMAWAGKAEQDDVSREIEKFLRDKGHVQISVTAVKDLSEVHYGVDRLVERGDIFETLTAMEEALEKIKDIAEESDDRTDRIANLVEGVI